jgi:hypothetical protein
MASDGPSSRRCVAPPVGAVWALPGFRVGSAERRTTSLTDTESPIPTEQHPQVPKSPGRCHDMGVERARSLTAEVRSIEAWGREPGRPCHLVVLRPSIDEFQNRDRKRSTEMAQVAYRPDRFTPEHLDALPDSTPRIGLWLDTSEQTPTGTVDEILRREAEAVVNGS